MKALLMLGALAWPLAGVLAWTAPAPAGGTVEQVGFTSADECGRCHRDIHRYWKASMHAQSADNWRFRDAVQRLKTGRDGQDADLCFRCHAPAASYARDARWERKTSWEGVTCDFCHSVTKVRVGAEPPFELDVGRVKSGPLRQADPVGHEGRYSTVHTAADLCAPCHQFVNRHRVTVLSTFAEWQASAHAARGVSCQACHMRAAEGQVVDPKIARGTADTVNLHEMPGGHSVVELNRALNAQITATRTGAQVHVVVQVANRGAGHYLPTGSPLRSIEMVVEAETGGQERQRATRVYGRRVIDPAGRPLEDEAAVWLHAAEITDETRLAPGERRTERFSFRALPGAPVRAAARFYYRYAPLRDPNARPFLVVTSWVDAETTRR